MKRLRPDHPTIGLETWFEKNFDPGIVVFLTEEIGLNEEEMAEEFHIWQGIQRVPQSSVLSRSSRIDARL
jgi:hypothetical protein